MKMEIDTQATVYYKYNFTKKKLSKNDKALKSFNFNNFNFFYNNKNE